MATVARSTEKKARAGDDRRQKLWRELAVVVLAPLLFYLLAADLFVGFELRRATRAPAAEVPASAVEST